MRSSGHGLQAKMSRKIYVEFLWKTKQLSVIEVWQQFGVNVHTANLTK